MTRCLPTASHSFSFPSSASQSFYKNFCWLNISAKLLFLCVVLASSSLLYHPYYYCGKEMLKAFFMFRFTFNFGANIARFLIRVWKLLFFFLILLCGLVAHGGFDILVNPSICNVTLKTWKTRVGLVERITCWLGFVCIVLKHYK